MWGEARSLYHFQGGPGSMHFRVTEVLVYMWPLGSIPLSVPGFPGEVLGISWDNVETPDLDILCGCAWTMSIYDVTCT